MPKIVARVPENIYKNINEEVKLGIFSDASEAGVGTNGGQTPKLTFHEGK